MGSPGDTFDLDPFNGRRIFSSRVTVWQHKVGIFYKGDQKRKVAQTELPREMLPKDSLGRYLSRGLLCSIHTRPTLTAARAALRRAIV